MKAVIPLEPLAGCVFAYTTKVEATGPFVILCQTQSLFTTTQKKKVGENPPELVAIKSVSTLNLSS